MALLARIQVFDTAIPDFLIRFREREYRKQKAESRSRSSAGPALSKRQRVEG
jgi:hypothetical protein